MYARHFGLEHPPFSIAPDPRFLYLSDHHREALAHLLYGLDSGGGVVLLSGEIGAGKTTVCRAFLEQMPAHCRVAYIFNPKLSVVELLTTVCEEFGLPHPPPGEATVKGCIDPLNAFLLEGHAAGRQAVLVIDEAQNLDAAVLEQLRLLTNLETRERKLLQIVLIGQPELRELLARPELEQLAQRVIARYHLGPLTEAETRQYIAHRLAIAGARGASPFTPDALRRIHRHSGGVPRRINLLADRALLAAYAAEQVQVDAPTVDRAAAEVLARPAQRLGARGRTIATGLGLLLMLALGWGLGRGLGPAGEAAPPAAPAALAGTASAPGPASGSDAARSMPAAGAGASSAAASSAPDAPADPLWAALAQRWKLPPARLAGAEPCEAVQAEGLRCQRLELRAESLRRLDRPGLLTLRRSGGGPSETVLLRGWTEDGAEIDSAQGRFTLPADRLAAAGRLSFLTLWRPTPGYRGPGLGFDEAQIEQAFIRLAPELGGSLPASSSLRERVRAFQRQQGLPADGLIGPLTLMQLNRALDLPEPRLDRRAAP